MLYCNASLLQDALVSSHLVQSDGEASYDACLPSLCMVKGHESQTCEPYEILRGNKWYVVENCGARCKEDTDCNTFAIGEGTCRLYHDDL
jgi:hypothetical protein